MNLTAAQIEAINRHVLKAYPNEACGVIKNGSYIPCRNVADKPSQSFRIASGRLNKLMPFDAVVHSHPDWYACPSEADMRGQASMALPWVIVATDGKQVSVPLVFGARAKLQPYEGRGFVHGVTDCYSLIRDWYKKERGVVLPEFYRDWEWWLPEVVGPDGEHITRAIHGPNGLRFTVGDDLYVAPFTGGYPIEHEGFEIRSNHRLYTQGYKEAGFGSLNDVVPKERGDVVLFQLPRMPTACHAGIYLGDGRILHHLTASKAVDPTRLSAVEPLTRWGNYIVDWLRYEG